MTAKRSYNIDSTDHAPLQVGETGRAKVTAEPQSYKNTLGLEGVPYSEMFVILVKPYSCEKIEEVSVLYNCTC